MKKLIKLFLIVIFLSHCMPTYSVDTKSGSDWGDNSSVFNKGFENQKPVTDSKLKETIKQIKERNLNKKQKKIREEVKPLSPSSDYEHLKNFTESQSPDNQLGQSLTVMIPVSAYSTDGRSITPGYYKLSCRKIAKDEYVLELSQGSQTVLTVKAEQTQQDLEQDSITFCNAEIISENRIRLMYGSIDLNLVGYLYFKSE